jgi:hypothetical protein
LLDRSRKHGAQLSDETLHTTGDGDRRAGHGSPRRIEWLRGQRILAHAEQVAVRIDGVRGRIAHSACAQLGGHPVRPECSPDHRGA